LQTKYENNLEFIVRLYPRDGKTGEGVYSATLTTGVRIGNSRGQRMMAIQILKPSWPCVQATMEWRMKLRIRDNSLRLRLTRKEVACLRDERRVASAIRFSATRVLTYSVMSSPDANVIAVDYDRDVIIVVLPLRLAEEWAENSDEITIEGLDSGVQILVEKDFQCLHGPGKLDSEAFPNPLG